MPFTELHPGDQLIYDRPGFEDTVWELLEPIAPSQTDRLLGCTNVVRFVRIVNGVRRAPSRGHFYYREFTVIDSIRDPWE